MSYFAEILPFTRLKTVLETLQGGTAYLEKRGVENARLNMQLLLGHVLGCSKLDLYLQFDRPLGEDELAPLRELLKRRGLREPLQHLLGDVEFSGALFACDSRALIPRPETEEMVDFLIQNPPPFETCDAIVDVGTGSGVIGLSLARAWRSHGLTFTLIDQSADALALAGVNREKLGLSEGGIHLKQSDLLSEETGPFRLIVANLPYIPSAEIASLSPEVHCDPPDALDGGADGLELVRRLIDQAIDRLSPQGMLVLELGIGQPVLVKDTLLAKGFAEVVIHADMSGVDRFLIATL